MKFQLRSDPVPKNSSFTDVVILYRSNWDDWFLFETTFYVEYFDKNSQLHEIGQTKIAKQGLRGAKLADFIENPDPDHRRTIIPDVFTKLSHEFYSLGQDSSYYKQLEKIGHDFREEYLSAMQDMSYELRLLDLNSLESALSTSLLRSVPVETVRRQFHRLAHGGVEQTSFNIDYTYLPEKGHPVELNFAVEPDSQPPSNIHVLIGRNGVGKTTLLSDMAKFMLDPNRNRDRDVANVVTVSFSAFDSLEPLRTKTDRAKGPTYRYVGLKKTSPRDKDDSSLKDDAALSRDMTSAAKVCLEGARRSRWIRAIEILESDPMFAEAGLSSLIASADASFFKELPKLFRRLSSGHKIVLLTITRLVETVVESTLVLMDEPETHLHPPLLSALIRSLSDLLIDRNGLAVVATHSPVVLQEVPSTCVWRLDRTGFELSARRPAIESFGENVGTLTNEVFGLEVTATGFHNMLSQVACDSPDYKSALEVFSGKVGAEGRAILRARMLERNYV